MNLSELRKEIKAIGFKVTTKRLSWGPHATYVHIDSGERLTFNVASEEQWKKWQPLLEYIRANIGRINTISETEGVKIYGLDYGIKASDALVL